MHMHVSVFMFKQFYTVRSYNVITMYHYVRSLLYVWVEHPHAVKSGTFRFRQQNKMQNI